MANKFIQGLYDMIGKDDNKGLTAMEETKFRRMLNSNKKLMARNKDVFAKGEPKFHTCSLYDPCPICDKCKAKASHLYVRCQTCKIPKCAHKHSDREKMIKRRNFMIKVSKETKEAILALVKEREIKNED